MATKFGYNANNKKSDWVRIEFYDLSEEQKKHLFKAEKELINAGVSFDTGFDFEEKRRDWEFDWSLEGAVVKIRETQREEKPKEEK